MSIFNLRKSLPFRLLLALIVGVTVGLIANEIVINIIQSIRQLTAQIIFFAVPLIILGFVTVSIARLGRQASRLLTITLTLGYGSAVGAAVLAAVAGYAVIPILRVPDEVSALRPLPDLLFELNIPPILPTMSALVLALLLGLAAAWTRAERFTLGLEEFHRMVLAVVTKVVIPVLPVFIATVFALLAYQGRLTRQLPMFLQALGLVIALQLTWNAVLYLGATLFSRRNPLEVIRHYGAPYLTAVGTMSSAATLPVALRGAHASRSLNHRSVDFGVPLFAHVHMPGSTVAITFLALTVSQVLYGRLPNVGTMVLFVILLGIFAVAAPGVPGGTLMASLGLITTILGFDEAGTGLMLAIFALQDSFGTATNITSDGPMLMVLSKVTAAEDVAPVLPVAGEGQMPEVDLPDLVAQLQDA